MRAQSAHVCAGPAARTESRAPTGRPLTAAASRCRRAGWVPAALPSGRAAAVNAAEITSKRSNEVAARVSAAGVTVIESRITQLAYAAEIARVMLQRQQATAVVAARQLIVEGAVGMVETAIEQIEGRDIVKLGHLERSDLVSNLMIVLCGDQAAQPTISTTRNQDSDS